MWSSSEDYMRYGALEGDFIIAISPDGLEIWQLSSDHISDFLGRGFCKLKALDNWEPVSDDKLYPIVNHTP